MIIYRVKRHNYHQLIGLVDDFPAPKRYVPNSFSRVLVFKECWRFLERCGQFLC